MLRAAGQNFYLLKEVRGNTDSLNLTRPTRVSLKSVSQGKKVEKWWPEPQNATEQFPRL